MTISVQQLRSAIPGAQPQSLDPGQVAFNVSDGTMYLGNGTDVKIDFSGATVLPAPPAGKGWIQVLLYRSALDDFFINNPSASGRPAPTNEQVLTWNSTLGLAEWQDAGTGFSYQTTDAAVTSAIGATTSEKISAAIGNPAYIGSNATCIVTGVPGTVYEGLYIFNGTTWLFAAHYAFNTASQVPGVNPMTLGAASTQAILNALKLVDDGLQTQITSNDGDIATLQGQMATAQTDINNLEANKLDIAQNDPVPNFILSYDGTGQLWIQNSSGDVTGVNATSPITVDNTDPQQPTIGINGASTVGPGAVQLSDSVSSTSSLQASTPFATKTAYDLAADAVPRSTYTTAGEIVIGTGAGTFGPLGIGTAGQVLTVVAGNPAWTDDAPGDVTGVTGTAPITVDNTDPQTPIVAVELATTATPGVVQVELTGNLTLVAGVIDVPNASTTVKGAVSLNNTLGSTSTTEALTAAQGNALQNQIDALTLSNSVTLAGGYDATTGFVDGVTSQGLAAGFVEGATPPLPAAGNADYYLICTTAGNIPSSMSNGDWLLSDGTQYVVLGIGARPASASYTVAGIVQLADAAAVLAGTSDTTAITPQALQDNVIDSVTTANSSQIASATAVKTANDNAVAANTAAGNAQTTANNALPKAGGTMTGTITAQNVNVQGTYSLQFAGGVQGSLNAVTDLVNITSSTTAASATAVKAANDAAGAAQTTANAALPRTGGTMTGNIAFQDAGEGVVFNGGSQVFAISDSTSTTSSTTAASATAVKAAFDAAGTASAAAAAAQATADAALPKAGGTMTGNITFQDAGEGVVFSGGSSIIAISDATGNTNSDVAASSTAVKNAYALADAAIPKATFTTAGQLLYGTGAGTFNVLPIGTNGQSLIVSAGAIAWGASLQGYTNTATPFNTALGALAGDSITTGVNNTAIGYNSGTSVTGGLNNTFVGFNSGDGITSADNNTAVGSNALSNSGGNNNTAIGYLTGAALTSGGSNTFVGAVAGDGATTADFSVAVGYNALGAAHTPNGTVAVGANALAVNTSGAGNTAVGFNAGAAITTGSNNTILGLNAGDTITTGTQNTFVGSGSGGLAATTVEGATAVGYNALGTGVTSGAYNTALGNNAGASVTSGALNTFVGFSAGSAVTTGGSNTLIGRYAGTAALANNVVLSDGAGTIRFQANSTGAWSPNGTNFGTAGQVLTSGGTGAAPTWTTPQIGDITAVTAGTGLTGGGTSGDVTLTLADTAVVAASYTAANVTVDAQGRITAASNGSVIAPSLLTATGSIIYASAASTPANLSIGTTGQILTVSGGVPVWGAPALEGYTQTVSPFNTALGANAGNSLTSGTNNVSVGHDAGTQISSGANNTLVGFQSGDSVTVGVNNTFIGSGSGAAVVGGGSNTALGYSSLNASTTGTGNTALGFQAMAFGTGSTCNVAIGFEAGRVLNGANNTLLGRCAGSVITSGSCNTLVGGYVGTATLANNVVLSDGAGNIKLQVNENGAVGVGTTPGYGTAGQVLTSGGTAAAPTWTTVSGGSLTGITSAVTTALGNNALDSITDPAVLNTAVGINAGTAITTGDQNTLVGYQAGQALTVNSANALMGHQAGVSLTGEGNVGIGNTVGPTGAATNSTFVGSGAGNIASGSNNVGIGSGSAAKATGNSNTAVGASAGSEISSGASNTFVGNGAGRTITTGSNNTIIGRYTGGGDPALSNNVVISAGASDIKLVINDTDAVSFGGLTNFGTAGQILMSNGTGAAPTWNSSAALLPNYGSFLSTVSQTNTGGASGNAATFNTTTENRNVSVQNGTQLTVAAAGTYNIQFSAQMTKTDGGSDDINIWFKKNGANVANSTSNITLVGNNTPQLATVNFILTMAAGDYVEIWWYSADANVILLAENAVAPYPAIPSIIATVVPVGA